METKKDNYSSEEVIHTKPEEFIVCRKGNKVVKKALNDKGKTRLRQFAEATNIFLDDGLEEILTVKTPVDTENIEQISMFDYKEDYRTLLGKNSIDGDIAGAALLNYFGIPTEDNPFLYKNGKRQFEDIVLPKTTIKSKLIDSNLCTALYDSVKKILEQITKNYDFPSDPLNYNDDHDIAYNHIRRIKKYSEENLISGRILTMFHDDLQLENIFGFLEKKEFNFAFGDYGKLGITHAPAFIMIGYFLNTLESKPEGGASSRKSTIISKLKEYYMDEPEKLNFLVSSNNKSNGNKYKYTKEDANVLVGLGDLLIKSIIYRNSKEKKE
jgi:hypothetical protein